MNDLLKQLLEKELNTFQDSIELGKVGKRVKIYFNALDREQAETKIKTAIELRDKYNGGE